MATRFVVGKIHLRLWARQRYERFGESWSYQHDGRYVHHLDSILFERIVASIDCWYRWCHRIYCGGVRCTNCSSLIFFSENRRGYHIRHHVGWSWEDNWPDSRRYQPTWLAPAQGRQARYICAGLCCDLPIFLDRLSHKGTIGRAVHQRRGYGYRLIREMLWLTKII